VLVLLSIFLVVVLAAIFAMDNMHRVELGLIVGRAVHVRLFFLLLSSFLFGCISAVLVGLYRRARSKKRRETAQDAESDDFFS